MREVDLQPPAAAEVDAKAYPAVGLRAIFQTKAWAARTVDKVRSRVMLQKIDAKAAEKGSNASLSDGNSDYYTPEALTLRRQLRHHADIVTAYRKLWVGVLRLSTELGLHTEASEENSVPRGGYRQFYWKLWLHMGADAADEEDVREFDDTFYEDWRHDVGEGGAEEQFMNFEQFSTAVYELADHWCDSLDPVDYVQFIDSLEGCAHGTPAAPPERAEHSGSLRGRSGRLSHRSSGEWSPQKGTADGDGDGAGGGSGATAPPTGAASLQRRQSGLSTHLLSHGPQHTVHRSGLLLLGGEGGGEGGGGEGGGGAGGSALAARGGISPTEWGAPNSLPPAAVAPRARTAVPQAGRAPHAGGAAQAVGAPHRHLIQPPHPQGRSALEPWRQQYRMIDYDATAISLLPRSDAMVLQYAEEYAGSLEGAVPPASAKEWGPDQEEWGRAVRLLAAAEAAPAADMHFEGEVLLAELVRPEYAGYLPPAGYLPTSATPATPASPPASPFSPTEPGRRCRDPAARDAEVQLGVARRCSSAAVAVTSHLGAVHDECIGFGGGTSGATPSRAAGSRQGQRQGQPQQRGRGRPSLPRGEAAAPRPGSAAAPRPGSAAALLSSVAARAPCDAEAVEDERRYLSHLAERAGPEYLRRLLHAGPTQKHRRAEAQGYTNADTLWRPRQRAQEEPAHSALPPQRAVPVAMLKGMYEPGSGGGGGGSGGGGGGGGGGNAGGGGAAARGGRGFTAPAGAMLSALKVHAVAAHWVSPRALPDVSLWPPETIAAWLAQPKQLAALRLEREMAQGDGGRSTQVRTALASLQHELDAYRRALSTARALLQRVHARLLAAEAELPGVTQGLQLLPPLRAMMALAAHGGTKTLQCLQVAAAAAATARGGGGGGGGGGGACVGGGRFELPGEGGSGNEAEGVMHALQISLKADVEAWRDFGLQLLFVTRQGLEAGTGTADATATATATTAVPPATPPVVTAAMVHAQQQRIDAVFGGGGGGGGGGGVGGGLLPAGVEARLPLALQALARAVVEQRPATLDDVSDLPPFLAAQALAEPEAMQDLSSLVAQLIATDDPHGAASHSATRAPSPDTGPASRGRAPSPPTAQQRADAGVARVRLRMEAWLEAAEAARCAPGSLPTGSLRERADALLSGVQLYLCVWLRTLCVQLVQTPEKLLRLVGEHVAAQVPPPLLYPLLPFARPPPRPPRNLPSISLDLPSISP